jgi:hypothetical protein
MQKGLKLHSSFLHWRHTGDEVWCGVLYFAIALMDKRIAILTGGSIVGLSAANSELYRLPVGFGLSYFLIGVVILDAVSYPLWGLARKSLPQPIGSVESLRQVTTDDLKAKWMLYVSNLAKFFFILVWGLAVTAALMWALESSRDQTFIYIAYVGAYTGLLWYQYNKVFTGPLALKGSLLAFALALTTGLLMQHLLPNFALNNAVALAIGTWSAAFLSLWSSKLFVPNFKQDSSITETPVFYSHGALDFHQEQSQADLSHKYDSINALSSEFRYRLDPKTHPGVEVLQKLRSHPTPSVCGMHLGPPSI